MYVHVVGCRLNDNGDGSRYLFASDAKNYTSLGEEALKGKKTATETEEQRKNCMVS